MQALRASKHDVSYRVHGFYHLGMANAMNLRCASYAHMRGVCLAV